MLPIMVPLQRTLSLDVDVGQFSIYTRLESFVTVATLARIAPGKGSATVNGVALGRWETVELKGVTLLFISLSEAMPDYGQRCRVSLRGFRTPGGLPFVPCAFTVTVLPRRQPDPAFEAHDAAALEAAREGMVLLRNDNGTLPLAADCVLNCLGSAQHWWRCSMAGASRINPRHKPGFHQAVAEHSGFRINAALSEYYRRARRDELPGEDLLAGARANGGPALVFIGRQWGEMMDLRDIPGEFRLSDAEEALLGCARANFRRVIVILNTGGPIDMTWLRETGADAVLFTGYAGMLSAHALVELLDGRVNPSGHLPDTWPWRFSDNPVSKNFPQRPVDAPYMHEDAIGVRVYYEEDIYMGYRWFDSFEAKQVLQGEAKQVLQGEAKQVLQGAAKQVLQGEAKQVLQGAAKQAFQGAAKQDDQGAAKQDDQGAAKQDDQGSMPVAFPFGHGLSYTTFELVPAGLEREGDAVRVRLSVRNTGRRAGKAVAQLYVAPPRGKIEKPDHVLVGFEKTSLLAPGDVQTLEIAMRQEDAASFDEERSAWVLEAGEYGLFVGQSLGDLVPAGKLALEARTLRSVKAVAPPTEDFKRLTRADPTVDGSKSGIVPLGQQIAVPAPRVARREASPSGRREASPSGSREDSPSGRREASPSGRSEASPSGRRKRVLWQEVRQDSSKLSAFVSQLSLLELCRLNVCAGSRWLPGQDGMAGHTPALKAYGLPGFCAADANPGLNLKRPNVGFPASSVIAATFNKSLAEQVGRVVAAECPAHGVDLVLAPGMNLHRSPLCGRHPEYFSEDPYLTGVMAACHARGLEEGGVGSCYKHLFCNNAELGRLGSHSVVSRRALRELYFRAFEIAFRMHSPRSVMTSYNALNGIYPGESRPLLEDLLRGEWGFEGFVMSDWGSVRTVDAVEMVNAGNSWITPGGPLWVLRVWNAARRGEITRATLEENVTRLLRGMGGV